MFVLAQIKYKKEKKRKTHQFSALFTSVLLFSFLCSAPLPPRVNQRINSWLLCCKNPLIFLLANSQGSFFSPCATHLHSLCERYHSISCSTAAPVAFNNQQIHEYFILFAFTSMFSFLALNVWQQNKYNTDCYDISTSKLQTLDHRSAMFNNEVDLGETHWILVDLRRVLLGFKMGSVSFYTTNLTLA